LTEIADLETHKRDATTATISITGVTLVLNVGGSSKDARLHLLGIIEDLLQKLLEVEDQGPRLRLGYSP
jgi:hypothetical protein